MQAQVPGERLYGLDWLRIGAFALLILYHIGMFFVPWEWHVKTSRPIEWLEIPMMAINPWRLALAFGDTPVVLAYGRYAAFLLSSLWARLQTRWVNQREIERLRD